MKTPNQEQENKDDSMIEAVSFFKERLEGREGNTSDPDMYHEETNELAEQKYGNVLSMDELESAKYDAEEKFSQQRTQ